MEAVTTTKKTKVEELNDKNKCNSVTHSKELISHRTKWEIEKATKLLQAQSELMKMEQVEEKEGETNMHVTATDVEIGANMTLETFLNYVRDKEKSEVGPIYFLKGSAFIYELPNITHGKVIGEVLLGLGMALSRDNVIAGSAGRCTAAAFSREPDVSFNPRNVPKPPPGPNSANGEGDPWPTLVIEIGVSQSLSSLHNVMVNWLTNQHVRVGIAIKIFGQRQGTNNRCMIAMRYTQANPNIPEWVVSFGTASPSPSVRQWINQNITNSGGVANSGPALVGVGVGGAAACNARGIALYQLRVPIAGVNSVFYNWNTPALPIAPAVAIPGAVGNHVSIDLFDIQRTI